MRTQNLRRANLDISKKVVHQSIQCSWCHQLLKDLCYSVMRRMLSLLLQIFSKSSRVSKSSLKLPQTHCFSNCTMTLINSENPHLQRTKLKKRNSSTKSYSQLLLLNHQDFRLRNDSWFERKSLNLNYFNRDRLENNKKLRILILQRYLPSHEN